MEVIQIIVILFVLFAYSRAILRFKDKLITFQGFIFWNIIWAGVIVFVLIPSLMTWVAQFIGIGRPIDIFIYLSIVLLFYLMFRLYVKLDQTEQSISRIVEKIAINKPNNKNNKK